MRLNTLYLIDDFIVGLYEVSNSNFSTFINSEIIYFSFKAYETINE